ncbi:PREDICTED: uncharacterized protein LOC108569384 [Nicrophorus vespilloides]|uniref:MICOS complex subunit n=1 Tax=Nicrophorus vespilloides TaxID=110193 RepID=A0ABM1NHV0_NICVS|nr:PREDICTED: uncharacterized protein LOC108569384 [Nicrophorus vespilloides]
MARQVLTRVLIPAAAVMTSEAPDYKCCKRTELPIYVPDSEKQEIVSKAHKHEHHEAGYLETSIGVVRKQIRHLSHQVQVVEDMGINYYNDGVEQAGWLINYLGEEDNMTPKYPAIAIGGLAGYIIALRGGFFRKLIFTSAGALGMASLCFPKEAAYYSEIGIEETRKYSHILYNFIYGVKKGDPQVELPSLPKMPGSVSEAWTMVVDLGKSAKNSIVSDGEPEKKN